jgi:hypothetical protein
MLRILPFLLVLALWIYAFIDCLNTPEKEVRNLPKVAWVIIVLLFGEVLLGPIAWFVAGRPRRAAAAGGGFGGGAGGRGRGGWVAPDDNPEFLKSLGEENRRKDDALRKERDAREEPVRSDPEQDGGPGRAEKSEKSDKTDRTDRAEKSDKDDEEK